ncbi:MAG: hypothetical protein K1060chlam2_00230 [Chlamydiae bacterium]|nr:hypothetical protein [Chlamydiota bacterium]
MNTWDTQKLTTTEITETTETESDSLDLLVEDKVIVEIKSVRDQAPDYLTSLSVISALSVVFFSPIGDFFRDLSCEGASISN